MINLYNFLLYYPIFNVLIALYVFLPGRDIGIAIIVFTVLLKMLLYPFTKKSMLQQKKLQALQPKLKELQTLHKDNKEALARASMELYKQQQVNPFSSCIAPLIQLPIFLAVYNAFSHGLTTQDFSPLYSFVPNPGNIDTMFFNLIDLSSIQTIFGLVLSVIAGILQYLLTRSLFHTSAPKFPDGHVPAEAKDENVMASVNKQMMYTLPILTVVIGYYVPAGLVLYWVVNNLLSLVQQNWIQKLKKTE